MSYILQYSRTLRWLSPSAFDGGLTFLILLCGSMLLARKGISHPSFGADLKMVALLSMSAVAATCAVRPRAPGHGPAGAGEAAGRAAMLQAARAALVGALIAVPLGYAYLFLSRGPTYPVPLWAQISIALVPVSVFLSQCLQRVLRPHGLSPTRVAIVGDRAVGERITGRGEMTRPLHVVGFFEFDTTCSAEATGAKGGDASDLRRFLEAARPDVVVVACDESRPGDISRAGFLVSDLLKAKARGVRVVDFPDFWENENGRMDLRSIRAEALLFGPKLCGSAGYLACKRAIDILVAFIALAATLWLFPLIALLVRLSSPGPAIFRQERVGRDGSVFTLLKFRSMRADAEQASGPAWARPEDPRVTPVGLFLRRTRLDELPQLWNILMGDMTLVGPRPERPHFVEVLSRSLPFYGLRHAMKPGLTGWAQVNNGYAASIDESAEKLSYDLFYIRHRSIMFDFYIMAKTLAVIFQRKGQ